MPRQHYHNFRPSREPRRIRASDVAGAVVMAGLIVGVVVFTGIMGG